MSDSNFDTYLVLLPTTQGGVDYGSLDPVQVVALDERDAVAKAAEKWWGSMSEEGVAVVVKVSDATAFVLGELRGVEITAETAVPNRLSGVESR